MAKKSRRVRKTMKGRKARLSVTQLIQPGVTELPVGSLATATPVQTMADLHDEYRYVADDLKRIAIVAAPLLAVVVILVLVLP